MANFYTGNNYAQRDGEAGFKFDSTGLYSETNGTGQINRLAGTIFSGGPMTNQAAPGVAPVNLWSMSVAPGALNVVNRTMKFTAWGYATTDGTGAAATFKLLLGTIPLVNLTTSAILLASQTQAMWILTGMTTVTTAGTASALETHGTIEYVKTTANTLVKEADIALVSGNIAPDLTVGNTLFLQFTGGSGSHISNVVAKNVLVELFN